MNNPVKFLDPDGRAVILNYLTDDGHKAGLAKFASTSQGQAFLSRYMGANSSLTIGGKTYKFNTDGKAGDRAKDNLYFQSSGEQGAANMKIVMGETRTYSKDMKTDLKDPDKKANVSKGVAEVITLNSNMQDAQQSSATIAHEAFVHVEKDANQLDAVDNSANPNQPANTARSSADDHCDFGTNGNENYKDFSTESDKKDNTKYYTEYYNQDRKDEKSECQ